MQNDIILSMADTVEDRDSNTGGHIKRTSECVRVFTEGLQNNPVYAKKGIFSLNVLLRQHLFMILHNSDDMQFRKVAENVAHYHHEKWDGTGYPAGLRGEEIPLESRIMALADVFDALVSKRCYKEKYSFDKAFSIIEESLGKHFNAKLGKLFIQQCFI